MNINHDNANEARDTAPQFTPWPKITRLNRDVVITEKIDGTNAAIGITPDGEVYAQSRNRIITSKSDNYGFARWVEQHAEHLRTFLGQGVHFGEWWGVGIGRKYDMSERRFSLFNTAKWHDHTEGLLALSNLQARGIQVHTVPILYTGPWTGNLGYKDGETGEWLRLDEQENWQEVNAQAIRVESQISDFMKPIDGYLNFEQRTFAREHLRRMIPVNPRPRFAPNFVLEWLARVGSQAAPGFMKPEGICVYHHASGMIFKATVENDEQHKFEVVKE